MPLTINQKLRKAKERGNEEQIARYQQLLALQQEQEERCYQAARLRAEKRAYEEKQVPEPRELTYEEADALGMPATTLRYNHFPDGSKLRR